MDKIAEEQAAAGGAAMGIAGAGSWLRSFTAINGGSEVPRDTFPPKEFANELRRRSNFLYLINNKANLFRDILESNTSRYPRL